MSTEMQEAFSNYIVFYQTHLVVSGNTDKDGMVRCGDQTTVPRDSPANTTCVFYTLRKIRLSVTCFLSK